ncbi:MAG: hypothetical protein HY823_14060 [Acidobacteria bacterium]|nr:hypothetical protein [Acidobacteriota bacterium]
MLILLPSSLADAQGVAGAQGPDVLMVRLIGSGGSATIDGKHHRSSEVGADLMLPANDRQRYGLRISSINLDVSGKKQNYLCVGVMLETVMFNWCRMEIGTVGFVGRGDLSGSNPFGLASFFGYEKKLGQFSFTIGYDSKIIFTKPSITVNGLGVGVGYHF